MKIDTKSTLTHVIPLINKTYYSHYSRSDVLWKHALIRLVRKQPKLWGLGLKAFSRHHSFDGNNGYASISDRKLSAKMKDGDDYDEAHDLVLNAGRCMEHILRNTASMATFMPPIYMELYRYTLSNYIKFTSPLFYMPDDIELGEEFGIHFFEPRYRLLISEVMAPFPAHYRNGDPITPNQNVNNNGEDDDNDDDFSYPTFIFANKSPLKRGTTVTIVEVRQCVIHHNQTADVFLMPKSLARIQNVRERPNSHKLYEARVVMLSQEECEREVEQSKRRHWVQLQQNTSGGSIGGGNTNNNGNHSSVTMDEVMNVWMMMQAQNRNG